MLRSRAENITLTERRRERKRKRNRANCKNSEYIMKAVLGKLDQAWVSSLVVGQLESNLSP